MCLSWYCEPKDEVRIKEDILTQNVLKTEINCWKVTESETQQSVKLY